MAEPTISTNASLIAAREVAQQVVRERFPELDGVEPQVSLRTPSTWSPGEAHQLGVDDVLAQTPPTIEYIFTFARELRTPEGYCMPHIARVTVDTKQRVIKAIHSK